MTGWYLSHHRPAQVPYSHGLLQDSSPCPRANREGKHDANPPLCGGVAEDICPDVDTRTSGRPCPSPALLCPHSPTCCMGTSSFFRAVGNLILHLWGFITTKTRLFTHSGSLHAPPRSHENPAARQHQCKGVHHPPGAIRSPKGGQGLHLGICHPEPPIVAHWDLLCWSLPLQRVCKGEFRVQAVSWLCLTGDGGHMQGCVATLSHHQAWGLLSETNFAFPFQAASHSYSKSLLLCSPSTHWKLLCAPSARDPLPEASAQQPGGTVLGCATERKVPGGVITDCSFCCQRLFHITGSF